MLQKKLALDRNPQVQNVPEPCKYMTVPVFSSLLLNLEISAGFLRRSIASKLRSSYKTRGDIINDQDNMRILAGVKIF